MPGMFFFHNVSQICEGVTFDCLGSVQGGEPPAEDEALPVSLPC